MYKLQWVIVHRDFLNLDYPAYYNRETKKLDRGIRFHIFLQEWIWRE